MLQGHENMWQGRAANLCCPAQGPSVYWSPFLWDGNCCSEPQKLPELLRIMKMRSVSCARDWERGIEFSVILSAQK